VVRQKSKARLEVRQAELADAAAIVDLVRRSYTDLPGYTETEVRAQINNFGQGCFVAELDEGIAGYCASIRVPERIALAPHTWREITGRGLGSRHDPKGDWLYGYEMCVDPKDRGRRLGRRLYEARRELAESLSLKGIAFGGRMPNLARYRKRVEGPQDYLQQVEAGRIHDPVIRFQLANGFQPIAVLEDYLPADKKSLGNAALMIWRNPFVEAGDVKTSALALGVESVRIACCQFQARAVKEFDEFLRNVEYFVDIAADYRSDFILFPELFTLQLLSFEKDELSPLEAIEKLSTYTPRIRDALSSMAMKYNINIIGGSHPTRTGDGDIHNVAFICLRDGAVHEQEKIHPTPNERYWWNIQGGDNIGAIQTDCGPIAVLICYDSEFPEIARRVVDEGARILFVPFCTDNRQGYMRVRYCAQARAIENQCFLAMAGNVGNLPNVQNMDIQYAQSCILTPCDFPFARDGIAAEASDNVEMLTIGDVNMSDLGWARAEGTVRNLHDRRFDLYEMDWKPKKHRSTPPKGEAPEIAPQPPGGG
jgi:predicted amidohydrolase/GNAT superfamily N-acetyltransferase